MGNVITYSAPNGDTLDIGVEQVRMIEKQGLDWPKNWRGEEYCTVSHGAHEGESDVSIVETMPDHLKGSHRAAGNWGVYPHNGAERAVLANAEAESIIDGDADGYARIVG